MRIRNLNKLPQTRLTSLELFVVEIEPDFDGVKFMKEKNFCPTLLMFVSVLVDGFFRDPKHVLSFIELVLRCRTLDVFVIAMRHLTLPKWGRYTAGYMPEYGLEVWVANLRANQPTNHLCSRLEFADMRNVSPDYRRSLMASDPPKNVPYLESERAVHLDYMELNSRSEIIESREQPFIIPSNADSYTIWINQRTKAYRVQPNTDSYSKRVSDIENRIRVNIKFVMDGKDGNTTLRPYSVRDLDNPEMWNAILYSLYTADS